VVTSSKEPAPELGFRVSGLVFRAKVECSTLCAAPALDIALQLLRPVLGRTLRIDGPGVDPDHSEAMHRGELVREVPFPWIE
jgi:hypothetical protein